MKHAKKLLVFLIVFVVIAFCPLVGAEEPNAEYIAIIVIDACRADYLDLAPLPNIKRLMAQGINYQRAWVGQLINNTPPAHATIGTGVFPKRHGIVGFSWKDPVTNKQVRPTDFSSVYSGEMGRIIAESGVPTLAGLFKEKFPSAKALAISSEKYYATAAMGNYTADYILFAHWLNGKYSPVAVMGHEAPTEFMNNPLLRFSSFLSVTSKDDWVINAISVFLKYAKPQILMVNLPGTDIAGHETGGIIAPVAMRQVVMNVDRGIGKLLSAYKKAGIFNKTIFVITADHGMIPNSHVIDSDEILDLIKGSNVKVPEHAGISHIWINKAEKSREVAEKVAQLGKSEIIGVYYKTQDESGNYTYLPANNPPADASYRYLLSTYASSNGPDVTVMMTENTTEDKGLINSAGNHGETTWFTQHIPMIISGPGVKKGVTSSFPARLVDIVPTVLALAGVEPKDMDGIVLADCMLSPIDEQIRAQDAIKEELKGYQDAMMSLSR